jgi:exopolysaccharide biosynthesis polyprenyl glycosylphosphotransferase
LGKLKLGNLGLSPQTTSMQLPTENTVKISHFYASTRKKARDIRASARSSLTSLSIEQWYRIALFICSDILGLGLAWKIAAYLNQFYSPVPEAFIWWEWFGISSLFWYFAVLTILSFTYGGLYQTSPQTQNYLRAGQLISYVYLFSLVISYFYDPKLDPPRSLFFAAWFASIFFIITCRLLLSLSLKQHQRDRSPIPIFLIAPATRIKKLAHLIEKRSNYRVVGAAFAATAHTPATLQAIQQSQAKEVFAEELPQTKLASTLYWQLRRSGIGLRLIPSSVEILHRRGVAEICAGLPTLRVETPLFVGWDYRLKRLLDIIGATIGIILLSPLFITIAITIKLSSPGPIFFRQNRIGLDGKAFKMWKFRTMVTNASLLQTQLEVHNQSSDGILFKMKNDPRIIKSGQFLRRTSLDELPQLFNVLFGQMSLVGPRPLPVRDVERFETWHHIRHQVLPGITGLWQISGRSDLDDFNDAARLDLHYIDNWSLNLDLDILVETMRIVVFGKGAY